ncbi:MAG: dockerin [Fibrobacter sp.]|nr:dockerin [Fibrobacter sp.]
MARSFKIGAWVGGKGPHPQPSAANIQEFQTLQGGHIDLVSLFALFDINNWDWVESFAEIARENGSTLVVTWMPNGYSARKITEGIADPYIRHFAKGVKNYGREIWLRPLHEANGDWYDWGVGKPATDNTDDNVAEAFRHIVDIFREESVPNVKWVWTTNSSNVGDNTTFTGTYPGDDYVDYVSIDGYNWGNIKCWSRWKTFSQVFKKSYNALAGIDKPIFIAETSCTESGGNKAEWITDMFKVLPEEFPKIFAVMWFSQSKSFEADWALDTSSAAVDAWKAGIGTLA